jgi:hypothetical protein
MDMIPQRRGLYHSRLSNKDMVADFQRVERVNATV